MGDVTDVNDNIFIFAGANLKVEKLSQDKHSWKEVGDMEQVLPGRPHYQQFTSVGINNRLFTFGGLANLIGDWNQTDNVFVMNISTYSWKKHNQSLMKARAWHKVSATKLFLDKYI